MPRAKKVEAVEAVEPVAEPEAVVDTIKVEAETVQEKEDVKPTQTEFTVLNSSGGEVRTYSVEIHGEDAEKLAHQFAANIGGSVQ